MTQEPPTLELLEGPSPEALLPNHGLWPWWLAAAVLILAGVALAVVIRRRRRQPFDAAALRETARRKALAALDDVRGEDPRETAVRTSLILREYLSVAAADPVLFETHEEFLARHDSLAALTPEARDAAQIGFDRLAALKYGPHQPAAEAASIVADCRGLLDTLHKGFTA
jgi:hypothetical protein